MPVVTTISGGSAQKLSRRNKAHDRPGSEFAQGIEVAAAALLVANASKSDRLTVQFVAEGRRNG